MLKVHNIVYFEKHRDDTDLYEPDANPPEKALVDFFLLLFEWNAKADKTSETIQKDV